MEKNMDNEMKRKLGLCSGRSVFQEALPSNTSKPQVGTCGFSRPSRGKYHKP